MGERPIPAPASHQPGELQDTHLSHCEFLNGELGDAHGFGFYAMLDALDRVVPVRTGSRAISRPAFSSAMRIS